MEPWQQIQKLRKEGQPEQGLKEGHEILKQDGDDFMVRSQLEWCHYDLIKQISQTWQDFRKKNQLPPPDLERRLLEQLREYARLEPRIPGMSSGRILSVLSPFGKELNNFPKILKWFFDQDGSGGLGLSAEDWKPRVWNENTYQSTALKLARGLAGWVKAHRDAATSEDFVFALEVCEKVLQEAEDKDMLWLEWDLTALHRMGGNFEKAEALLKSVLKAKRTEFWAWAEAGRLYRESRPGLAKSCFCQAARISTDPTFKVRVHLELAELLTELGERAQASREAVIAVEIYDQQGWSHPKELEALLGGDWYDPSLPHESPEAYYSHHAERALLLCYDSTDTVPANYIGLTEGKDGKKPVPRFAVPDGEGAFSLLGKRSLQVHHLQPGQPLEVTLATEGSRRDILDIVERADGSPWDIVGKQPAVVSRVFEGGDQIEVYIDREHHFRVPTSILASDVQPHAGMGLLSGIVRVGKKSRPQVTFLQPHERPEIDDFRVVTGSVRRIDAGFAFLEDVFIAPHLLNDFPDNAVEAVVMAVVKWNKKREEWGWQAICISPTDQPDTEPN